jgi:hypothetical protein
MDLTSPNSEAAREFQNDGLLSPGRHLVGLGDWGMASAAIDLERHWILLETFGHTLWTNSHQLTPSTYLSVVF